MDDDDAAAAADWDLKARAWDAQVGESGDRNRMLNSDPVLWRLLGDVKGQRVLDAGCGTGYLSRALVRAGAKVTGIDVSPKMIAIAQAGAASAGLAIEHHVASATHLETLADQSMDAVVSNYVLMDFPGLEDACTAMARVLVPGGRAVLVFSHPCFPQGDASGYDPVGYTMSYHWTWSYFGVEKRVDPPWKNFNEPFVWWHRPLSAYVRAFRDAGLGIDAIEEPHLPSEHAHLANHERERFSYSERPFSIAFRLLRP